MDGALFELFVSTYVFDHRVPLQHTYLASIEHVVRDNAMS